MGGDPVSGKARKMTARDYHDLTKHSPRSVRTNAHYLDWDNYPMPFKIYPDLEPILLPRETRRPGGVSPWTREALTHLLYFSAGITRRRKYPGGEILFRAAACTGALYEIELYVVCGDLEDLEAGVYDFGPGDLALRRLRSGDWRGALAGMPPAPLYVVSTGTYWRNAWKYQARTYRHFGWDNGTILANLVTMAEAQGWRSRVLVGFVDAEVNRLLGLDTEKEVALSVVALGETPQVPVAPGEAPELRLATVPVSREEVDYPLMREMHACTELATVEDVLRWRLPIPDPGPPTADPRPEVEDVILRRGSSRKFRREAIRQEELAGILEQGTRAVVTDFGRGWNELYLIVNAVQGLDAGAYYYRAEEKKLELLQAGEFRREAAYLGLEQDLPGDAAVAVFFLADLERMLGRLGNRGYRAVQLEAGIMGGKMYLAAYGQRLGATGLTFFDDDVVRFFSPHAAGKDAIFLMAAGHPARRSA